MEEGAEPRLTCRSGSVKSTSERLTCDRVRARLLMEKLTMSLSLIATRPFAFLLATVLLATLTGCQTPFVKQEVIQPTRPLDQACVARCDLLNTQCQQRQRIREQECQQHFTQVRADHAACVASNGLHCLQPVACLGVDMSICTTQREECLQTCQVRLAPPLKTTPRTDGVAPTPGPRSNPTQAEVSTPPS